MPASCLVSVSNNRSQLEHNADGDCVQVDLVPGDVSRDLILATLGTPDPG